MADSDAARSWGGSAAKGGSPHEQLPWFPPLAQSMADSDAARSWGFPPLAIASRQRIWSEPLDNNRSET
ncbi:hypothetical protein [Moorena bouillonii]|nr:hypothetical protein [Moorena bouillonii]